MGNPVDSITDGARLLDSARGLDNVASNLLQQYRQASRLDVTGLARDLGELNSRDPQRAGALLREVVDQIGVSDRGNLGLQLADTLDDAALGRLASTAEGRSALEAMRGELIAASPSNASRSEVQKLNSALESNPTPTNGARDLDAQKRELMLDLTQIGLTITGIVDPTPISDGANLVISLGRGDWFGAVIDGVSMLPYLGDVAKVGKLGKFAETIGRAIDIAKVDSAFARQIEPVMRKLGDALNAAPLDSLPAAVREPISAMKRNVDEFLSAGTRAANTTYDVTARTGRNEVKWTLDAQGQPLRAEARLSEVFTNASRSSAETGAQGAAAARGVADDAGGHIIGHRFVLDQGNKNLFPQNSQFNNSAYRTMENEWASWIGSGKEVRVQVELGPQGAARPGRVGVTYDVVDPKTAEVVYSRDFAFNNQAGQVFDRVPTADMARY